VSRYKANIGIALAYLPFGPAAGGEAGSKSLSSASNRMADTS
jgi:hypothetical protein